MAQPQLGREATTRARLLRLSLGAWLLASATVAATTVCAVVASHVPVLFWDQWADIATLIAFDQGKATFADLWALHNEHSIPFPRLLHLVDYYLFGFTGRFLYSAILVLQFLVCGLLSREVLRARDWSPPLRWFVAGALLAVVLSAVQIEHLTTPFSINFSLAFAAPVVAAVCLANAIDRTGQPLPRAAWLFGVLVCGVVAPFSVSNGLLLLPLLVLFAWAAPLPRRTQLLLSLAAAGIWAWRWSLGFRREAAAVSNPPLAVLRTLAYYLGTPLWQWPERAFALGLVGLVLGIGASLIGLGRLRRLTRLQRIALFVLWFNLGSGGIISLGRAGFPFHWVLVSRYATGALSYWASLIVLITDVLQWRRGVARRLVPVWVGALAAGVLGALAPAHLSAARSNMQERVHREQGELAFVVGAHDTTALERLYWNPLLLWRVRPWLQHHELNSFAYPWTTLLGRPLPSGTPAPAVLGMATHATPLPPPPAEFSLEPAAAVRGWAWDSDRAAPPELIVIADDLGIVRGFGRPTRVRPLLQLSVLRPPPQDAHWAGYMQVVGREPWAAYAVDMHASTVTRLDGALHVASPSSAAP